MLVGLESRLLHRGFGFQPSTFSDSGLDQASRRSYSRIVAESFLRRLSRSRSLKFCSVSSLFFFFEICLHLHLCIPFVSCLGRRQDRHRHFASCPRFQPPITSRRLTQPNAVSIADTRRSFHARKHTTTTTTTTTATTTTRTSRTNIRQETLRINVEHCTAL